MGGRKSHISFFHFPELIPLPRFELFMRQQRWEEEGEAKKMNMYNNKLPLAAPFLLADGKRRFRIS